MRPSVADAPRRVLMTTDAVGGVWTYAIELARGLAARGTEVTLCALGPAPSAAQRAEAQSIPRLVVETLGGRLEWMPGAECDVLRQGEWLLALERRVRPDLVHLNGYAHAALGWRAPTVAVAHSCVASWWRACRGCDAPAEWDIYRSRVAEGIAAAGLLVAPTRAFLAEIAAIYGAPGRCAVIPNGRDGRRFPPLPKRRCVFGCGRLWDEAKNVRAMAEAGCDLPWPVLVAGDVAAPDGGGGDVPPDSVTWLGRLAEPELARWLGEAAIFAHPARYEPFGLAVLEAAMAGAALVLGDIPTLRELWDGAAMFVDPARPDLLARALSGLMADEDGCRALGEAARLHARRFSAPRMVDLYCDAYAALTGGRARTRRLEPAL